MPDALPAVTVPTVTPPGWLEFVLTRTTVVPESAVPLSHYKANFGDKK